MRVLQIDSGREMRGGQWQCLELACALGAESALLAAEGGPLMRAARARGVEAHALSLFNLTAHSRGVDAVHAHDARSHAWAAALSSAPVIVSRRVAFPVQRSPLSRWKYARAAHYIAISDCVRRTLLDAGVPAERIAVVYDGVAVPVETARPEIILAVETPDPMKGSDLVRKAAVAGGFAVHFSSDLQRDLPRAAAFLYITHAEGLGSAALLAMAHGVPVVASRVGGLPEIVQDGITGVLTDNEPLAIARALERALAGRDRLAANARAAVMSRFTVSAMVEGTRCVYRKVLGC